MSDGKVLQANAWSGKAVSGELSDDPRAWGLRKDLERPRKMLAPDPLDYANWQDSRIGWGIVLRDSENGDGRDKAIGAQAPEPIRKLLAARAGSPVLYYTGNSDPRLYGRLRRYSPEGTPADLRFSGNRGTGPNAIPYYLLIVGSPEQIPWSAQYRMQSDAYVGRLDLDPAGLERYVDALLSDWSDAKLDTRRPVVWAVDHGPKDITRLMRKTIAEPLAQRFARDVGLEFDMAGGFHSDAQATHAMLINALEMRKPAFIATSSHGATFPLTNPHAMRMTLGLPVDNAMTLLDIPALTRAWDPYGAIWYSHACCSAGTDQQSVFAGLVKDYTTLAETLNAIAKVGACSAPLPRELLGGKRPARAFVGHVEPTFDWTLRDKDTGQVTTQRIIDALYGELHVSARRPLGFSMQPYFRAVGGLMQDYTASVDDVDAAVPGADESARSNRLMAYDCLATVLLGDPTVKLPPRI